MVIHPTDNRVFILQQKEEKNTSGIIIPDAVKKEQKPCIGKVAKVGPSHQIIEAGDVVIYDEYAFSPVTIHGIEYQVGRELDILAILSDEAPTTTQSAA